mmetsp:Transcript_19417/g.55669  ORF Transcript_19417/g.55669 Transcript_19417/m.55669 type:complete len:228 (+) Transcript_19417:1212-1895(+)
MRRAPVSSTRTKTTSASCCTTCQRAWMPTNSTPSPTWSTTRPPPPRPTGNTHPSMRMSNRNPSPTELRKPPPSRGSALRASRHQPDPPPQHSRTAFSRSPRPSAGPSEDTRRETGRQRGNGATLPLLLLLLPATTMRMLRVSNGEKRPMSSGAPAAAAGRARLQFESGGRRCCGRTTRPGRSGRAARSASASPEGGLARAATATTQPHQQQHHPPSSPPEWHQCRLC